MQYGVRNSAPPSVLSLAHHAFLPDRKTLRKISPPCKTWCTSRRSNSSARPSRVHGRRGTIPKQPETTRRRFLHPKSNKRTFKVRIGYYCSVTLTFKWRCGPPECHDHLDRLDSTPLGKHHEPQLVCCGTFLPVGDRQKMTSTGRKYVLKRTIYSDAYWMATRSCGVFCCWSWWWRSNNVLFLSFLIGGWAHDWESEQATLLFLSVEHSGIYCVDRNLTKPSISYLVLFYLSTRQCVT